MEVAGKAAKSRKIGGIVKRMILLSALVLITSASGQQTDSVEYLIFAKKQYLSVLQPLADWKTRKGVPAKIMTDDSVPWDTVHIRACIKNYHDNLGTRYVLLVGLSPNDIPCDDVYDWEFDRGYADCNGDRLADVWLGRLPCLPDSVAQCARMVDKILQYEQNPPPGNWCDSATTIRCEDFPEEDEYYKADIRYVKSLLLSKGYQRVDSFAKYEGDTPSVAGAVEDSISAGRTFVLFRGSAVAYWTAPFHVQPESIRCGYELPVVVSGCCQTVGLVYPYDVGMNSLMFLAAGSANAPRGAVAYFGTTLTTMDDVSYYRSIVSRMFFNAALTQDSTLGGAAEYGRAMLMDSMRINRPPMDTTRYWEWNLDGDPEMKMWTGQPTQLHATFPTLLPAGAQVCTVTVTTSTGTPVPNAYVCVMMADMSVYSRGYTNPQGQVVFSLVLIHNGSLLVTATCCKTATCDNYIPFQGSALVTSNLPLVDSSNSTWPTQAQHMVWGPTHYTVHTVYWSDGGWVVYQKSTDGQVTWQPPETLARGYAGPPSISLDYRSNPWVVFGNAWNNVNCWVENEQGAWKEVVIYSDPNSIMGPVSMVCSNWQNVVNPIPPPPDMGYAVFTSRNVNDLSTRVIFCAFDTIPDTLPGQVGNCCHCVVTLDSIMSGNDETLACIARTPKDLIHVTWQTGKYSGVYMYCRSTDTMGITPSAIRHDSAPPFLLTQLIPGDYGSGYPVVTSWGDSVWVTYQVSATYPPDTVVWRTSKSLWNPRRQWTGGAPWSAVDSSSDYPDISDGGAVAWIESYPGADSFELRARFMNDPPDGYVYYHTTHDTLFSVHANVILSAPNVSSPSDELKLMWTERVGPGIYQVKSQSFNHPWQYPMLGDPPTRNVYYAAAVGDSAQSLYCLKRDGYHRFRSYSVDYALDSLRYRLPWLDPIRRYLVRATFYQESQAHLTQQLKLGDTTDLVVDIDSGKPVTVWLDIPPRLYRDGTAHLTLSRLQGSYAALADLQVFQYDGAGNNGGGTQAAGIQPLPRTMIRAIAPNPFRNQACVCYQLGRLGPAHLVIFDVSGRAVRTLENPSDGTRAAGLHTATWDGCDDLGRRVSGGVYFCRLEAAGQTAVSKLVLAR
jgi:hypothetical protein